MGFLVALLTIIFAAPSFTAAAPSSELRDAQFWHLPKELNDQNLSVSFEVDSTWHMVKGATSAVTGKAWLDQVQDFRSVRGEVTVPVANFDTDNNRRDRRMREVMQAEQFPTVSFRLEDVQDICDPQVVKEGYLCKCRVRGKVKIRDVEKTLDWPTNISYDKSQAAFILEGYSDIRWQEFGIEDPSIIIAKVDPIAKIKFILTLRS